MDFSQLEKLGTANTAYLTQEFFPYIMDFFQ